VNTLDFTIVVFAGSLFAGFLGSLTGLGGGVVIVPLLTVAPRRRRALRHRRFAVSVIATLVGLGGGLTQGRLHQHARGDLLEVATTSGPSSEPVWRRYCRDASRSSSASCCYSRLPHAESARARRGRAY